MTDLSSEIFSATVTITGGLLAGDQLDFTNQNGITGSYSSGVLTLSGVASASAYQAALNSVAFSSTALDATNGGADMSRTVTFSVTDAVQSSNVVSTPLNLSTDTQILLDNGQLISTEAALNAAIRQADAMPANTGVVELDLGADVALASPLEAINLKSGVTLDFEGHGYSLDGENAERGLFVYSGDVTIANLTIKNALAEGGNGGVSPATGIPIEGGGGGGAGLGGGLFIADDSAHGAAPGDVTLTDVSFTGDAAVGGQGGVSTSRTYGAGGGGMGGDGGSGAFGGGGGGLGAGAAGGAGYGGSSSKGGAGIVPGAAGGGDVKGNNKTYGFGGASGGGGGGEGHSALAGAGGGIGGAAYNPHSGLGGGTGGFGGGGGGSNQQLSGGAGGFGGGGGGSSIQRTSSGQFFSSGAGGFGGGGGSVEAQFFGARGGFGAGDGTGNQGGGGLAAGGDIFVMGGATLTIKGGAAAAGAVNGGAGGNSGAGLGNGFFIEGDDTITFDPGAGVTRRRSPASSPTRRVPRTP